MHLLLDQGLPRDAAILLRDIGHECTHVGEIGMWKAADEDILAWALGRHVVVITLDADFHMILAISGARGPSVMRLRIQGLRAPAVVEVVLTVLNDFQAELEHGAVVTVKPHKITCHLLPIGSSE